MNVFVYGTLRDDVLRNRLLARDVECHPARLDGYVVLAQTEAHLPAIQVNPGTSVEGLVLTDLSETEVARLDAYETPFGYNPVECEVQVEARYETASVYLPDATVKVSDKVWSLRQWQDGMGPASREMAVEIGLIDPPLTGQQLAAQWHMIALRASVRLRARSEIIPSNIRFQAGAADFAVRDNPTLLGDFFRLAQVQLTHRTFAGGTSGALQREIFIGTDAALVLPYDPKTDCVLLVEQIRMGPLMRGAANPWSLEPIAGMIDAGETPDDAALRESAEEAGLKGIRLEKMFGCYPTPGGATDYFYCYAGLCNLPAPTTYTGGLADEAEDLRLHVLSFDDAMALIETGEANVGPLIAMLYWLSRNRDRLGSTA